MNNIKLIKYEVKTIISVKENITDKQLANIVDEFEETAWVNDCSCYQPKVTITKL